MSHIHLDTVSLNENLLRALNQRDVASLTGGGVQINNGNVIPWRARHPQVCLQTSPRQASLQHRCCRIVLSLPPGDQKQCRSSAAAMC